MAGGRPGRVASDGRSRKPAESEKDLMWATFLGAATKEITLPAKPCANCASCAGRVYALRHISALRYERCAIAGRHMADFPPTSPDFPSPVAAYVRERSIRAVQQHAPAGPAAARVRER